MTKGQIRRRAQRGVAVAGALVLAAGGVAACGDDDDDDTGGGGGANTTASQSKDPIKMAALQGTVPEGGPDFTQGMQVAVSELNAKGGIEGRKVELEIIQTKGSPEGSATAYRSAGQDDAVIGAFLGASGAGAVKAQADRVQLPLIIAAGTKAVPEPVNKYVFANSADSEYATSSLVHAVEKLGAKKIGVLHYETDFSVGLTPAMKERCKQLGCTITTEQQAASTDSVNALTPQLTKLKNSGADAYYIESLNPNAIKAARQLGMGNKPIIAEQWLTVPPVAQASGKDAEGVVFGGHKCRAPEILEDSDPLKKWCDDYIAAYKKRFPKNPFPLFSIYGYDAVNTYAEAARRLIAAGEDVNKDNIAGELEKFDGKSFRTSHGLIKSAPDDHRLVGTWKEAYVNMNIKVKGKDVTYVIADKADPAGATP